MYDTYAEWHSKISWIASAKQFTIITVPQLQIMKRQLFQQALGYYCFFFPSYQGKGDCEIQQRRFSWLIKCLGPAFIISIKGQLA